MTVTQQNRRLAGLLSALALCFTGSRACAQAEATGSGKSLDVAVTYAAAYSNHTDQSQFWMQGGAVQVQARVLGRFGIAGAATGLASSSSNIAPLNLITYTFGPTYTMPVRDRFHVYAEALIGEAQGFDGLFATGRNSATGALTGVTSSATSLAVQVGGGVDYRLTERFGVRALQFDYLRTQLPNAANNVQNNFRIAAGLLVHFGS